MSQYRKSEDKMQKTGRESRDKGSESTRERGEKEGVSLLMFGFPIDFPYYLFSV